MAPEKLSIQEELEMKRELEFASFDATIDPREIPRYSILDVASYIRLPENTLRSWVSGRSFPKASGDGYSKPLIEPADGEGSVLSFYNLIEAHILKSTRRRDDVPMKFIRAAIDYVLETFPSPHPLITQKFETDGRFLFIRRFDDLINASKHGQLGIGHVLNEYLSRIDRDTRGMPVTLYPVIPEKPDSKAVAIRYGVSAGAPVLSGTGILVSSLLNRYQAGDTVQDLADDYDQPKEKIKDAIAYLEAA